jgi:tRNA(Ile)-lysidine synthase
MALMLSLVASFERVVVAHVHHHRRDEADAELELVRDAAARFGAAFECAHLDSDPTATPADLREARYAALIRIATSHQAGFIATGHQAEDQLETVLLAMIRGAGPRGLVGMRMRRGLCDGIDLLRPMLEVRREDAQDLCERAGVAWCDDPTNEDPSTLRGLLRRDVLPVIESIRGGAAQRISESTPLRQAAADALDASVVQPVDARWPRGALAGIAEGIRRASIHVAAAACCGGADGVSSASVREVSAAIIDQKQHRRSFEIGGGVVCVVEAKWVRLETESGVAP